MTNGADRIENEGKERETLIVEKQKLIDAILELERQEEIQSFLMLKSIQRMEVALQELKGLLHAERTLCAKHKLHQLFLPNSEWIQILTDDRIHAWQAEAQSLK